MRAPIRVLIVDDSALIRQMLTRALSMDPGIEVLGIARNGVEAIEKAASLSPDVITLDVEMPELSGIEALPHIAKRTSARVVMLTSLDDPETTYRALSAGAVDFLPKPSAGMATSITDLTEVLLKKIKMAYRITPDRAAAAAAGLSSSLVSGRSERSPSDADGRRTSADPPIAVCVAASTGGPPALERMFGGLSATMNAAYVVVQHLPAGFAESLARRLNAVGNIEVRMAAPGDVLEAGKAYLAPYGNHLVVEPHRSGGVLRLHSAPPLHGVRPAADPLFRSAAEVFGPRCVGVVLTGMGSDAGDGALAIHRAGGEVVVQDEESSIVWGMPSAAIARGAAHRAVNIAHVAAEIRRAVRVRSVEGVPRV